MRHAVLVEQYIRRLQIQVQHAEAVGVGKRLGHRAHQHGGALRFQRSVTADCFGEAMAAHQSHAEKVQFLGAAYLVDRHNIGMLHARGVLRFAPESFDKVARGPRPCSKELDRDFAIETDLPRAVDHAHAAFADEFEQFVVAELPLCRIIQIQFQRIDWQQREMTQVRQVRR